MSLHPGGTPHPNTPFCDEKRVPRKCKKREGSVRVIIAVLIVAIPMMMARMTAIFLLEHSPLCAKFRMIIVSISCYFCKCIWHTRMGMLLWVAGIG